MIEVSAVLGWGDDYFHTYNPVVVNNLAWGIGRSSKIFSVVHSYPLNRCIRTDVFTNWKGHKKTVGSITTRKFDFDVNMVKHTSGTIHCEPFGFTPCKANLQGLIKVVPHNINEKARLIGLIDKKLVYSSLTFCVGNAYSVFKSSFSFSGTIREKTKEMTRELGISGNIRISPELAYTALNLAFSNLGSYNNELVGVIRTIEKNTEWIKRRKLLCGVVGLKFKKLKMHELLSGVVFLPRTWNGVRTSRAVGLIRDVMRFGRGVYEASIWGFIRSESSGSVQKQIIELEVFAEIGKFNVICRFEQGEKVIAFSGGDWDDFVSKDRRTIAGFISFDHEKLFIIETNRAVYKMRVKPFWPWRRGLFERGIV